MKVTGALFGSFSTGMLGEVLAFSNRDSGPTVGKPPPPNPSRTDRLICINDQFRDAQNARYELPKDSRPDWSEYLIEWYATHDCPQ